MMTLVAVWLLWNYLSSRGVDQIVTDEMVRVSRVAVLPPLLVVSLVSVVVML